MSNVTFRDARKNDAVESSRQLSVAVLVVLATAGLILLWCFNPAEVPITICGLHALTGLHCPGCGATRATHELLHGRLLSALHCNALWTLSLPWVVYAAASELRMLSGRRALPGNLTHKRWLWTAVATVAMAFFMLRNLPWEPFLLLSPG